MERGINQFATAASSFAPSSPNPASPKLQSQLRWPHGHKPTHEYKVPGDLIFSPDADGSYRWTEYIGRSDDVAIHLDTKWLLDYHYDLDPSAFELCFRISDGDWKFDTQLLRSEVTVVRFRLKPGIQDTLELKFTLRKP